MRLQPSLESWVADIRHAARGLRHSPGFAGVAILTLALGIGANTAIFTVVNAILLRPLPYKDSDRLVRLIETLPATGAPGARPRTSSNISVAELLDLRAKARTVSHIAINGGPALMTMSGAGESTRLQGMQVAAGLFDTLGVAPLLGRGFGPTEEMPGSEGVVIFSYAAWQRHFGGDQNIVGRTVTLANSLTANPQKGASRQFTVVGVMPESFAYPDGQMHFWLPVNWTPTTRGSMIARLSEGASVHAAEAELGGIVRALRNSGTTAQYQVVPVIDGIVESVRPALLILAAGAGVVLLIACVNVANLLLARMAGRDRELAVRSALGAGRLRLVRHLLTESLMLAILGGIAGAALASGGVRLLRTLAATLGRMDLGVQLAFPRLGEVAMDASVVAFVIGASIATGLLFGLAPAIRYSRPRRELHSLRESAATAYAGFSLFRRGRTRAVLVLTEIALAMMLLVAGALLVRSVVKLLNVDPGYDATNVLTFQIALPAERYPTAELLSFADRVVARVESIPGVAAAAHGRLPMVAITETAWFRKVPELPKTVAPGSAEVRLISRAYFDVMRIRLVAGRGFRASDRAGGPRVLVINQTLARREFPGEDPVGRRVFAGRDSTPWEIVGVAGDVRQASLDIQPGPQVFALASQWPDAAIFPLGPYFSLRAASDSQRLLPQLRDIARTLDAEAGLFNVATMEQIVSNRVSRPRLFAVLLGTFAAVAGVLSLVGIYGVMAYSVSQRRREIGIRMAIGARRSEVLTLVLGQSALITLLGIASGLAGAALLTRYLEGMLFGLTPLDRSTFAAVATIFGAVAIVAAYLPARKATEVDPVVALRCE